MNPPDKRSNHMPIALICGISGQDGSYLARLLLKKGYAVYGGYRGDHGLNFSNLQRLDVYSKVKLLSMNLQNSRSVAQVLQKIRPDEVYNLSGQSSVGLSFERPVETLESIAIGTLNLLESIRSIGYSIRFFSAGSSECFGRTNGMPANEHTPFQPSSPYGIAKATAFWEVVNYREAYKLYACTGILFNHESPLRSARFVTRKIISTACRIAAGNPEKLHLGNMEIERDWGWAPEYVEAMWLMLQEVEPSDFIIATGTSNRLLDFVQEAFSYVGLEWRDHIETDPDLFRPADIITARADLSRAESILGWKATKHMSDIIHIMVDVEQGEIEIQNL